MRVKGWRTVAVNILVLIAALLPPVQHFLTEMLASPEQIVGVLGSVLALVNLALRWITDTPVGSSR